MRDLFVTLVVFGFLPVALIKPHIGILVWAWLAYMNPHKLSWGFAHDFPFALLTALAILVGLLISREPKKIPWTPETVILLLFIGWMFLTTLVAVYPPLAWQEWDKVWKIQLMTYVTMMVMTTRERVHAMVWIIALSIGFYGFKGGIFTLLTGGAYAVYGPGGSFISGNNEIGLALIVTVPLIRYLQLTTQQQWLRTGLLVTMVLCLISIIGTQSRGALVGLAAMSLFLVAKSRKKFFLIVVLAISIPMIISFMPDTWHARMHTIETYEEDQSAQGRLNAWSMAFNLAKDRILGAGYDCFRPALFRLYAPNPYNVHDAHSIYFEVLGEHGFIGLFLFGLLGLASWKRAAWIIKRTRENPELKWMSDLAAMLQASLVGYGTAGAFLGLAYFDLYYNLIAILVICKVILDREWQAQSQLKQLPITEPNDFIRPAIAKKAF
jgi:probable O-glycosylation ligase (exosortase A-associated)